MARGKRNIDVVRGDDYAHRISFVDSAGAAIDLTGSTFRAELRRMSDTGNDTPLAAFTVDDDELADGVVTVSLPRATTTTLALGAGYVWDLEQTDSSDVVTTWFPMSQVSVVPDASRS